jgi:hypothetical protein
MTTRYVPAGFALALCLHFLTTADSKAQDVDLTDVIGGACVPDSATVRAGLYETAGFGVRFGSGTGRIRLLCPYHLHSDAIGSRIGITMMSFIDQDGMEVGARVRANLRFARLGTNIGTCDSNTSNITGPTNIACFMPPHTATINESYWWEILIDRSDPRVNVEFLMVGMRYFPAEAASARSTTTSARPSGVLTPEQCNEVWSSALSAPPAAHADVAPENFAQVDDIAQIDTNNDGTIDRNEFAAACAKGLVHVPRPNRR